MGAGRYDSGTRRMRAASSGLATKSRREIFKSKSVNNAMSPNADDGFPGQFRIGSLDISLLDYAVHCNQGIDLLAVNHADFPVMEYCADNGMNLRHPGSLFEQEGLTRQAWQPVPRDSFYSTPKDWPQGIAEMLDMKLFMIGKGPTYFDKMIQKVRG